MNSFSSPAYKKFEPWQKVIFWFGILSFVHPAYWLVRLILYLVVQNEPFAKRINFYTKQTYVFGWIVVIVLGILTIAATVAAIIFAFAHL
jgi:hypothetical protein